MGIGAFQNKTIWITGASSGLGEALAYAFSDEGANLILSARRTEALEAVKSKVKQGRVLTLDLEKKETFQDKTKEAISLFGSIDIIIHNAGIAQRSMVVETNPEVERKIMEIDYFSFTELTRCLLPHFVSRKNGHIVVVSGLLADIHLPGRSSYAAAKSALLGYFGCLRAELVSYPIDVTLLIPGSLQTDLVTKALDKDGKITGGKAEQTGCPLDLASRQIITAIKKRKYQTYIGKKDKVFVLWNINKLFPNFITRKLLKNVT